MRALPSKPIQAETNPEQATVDPARELATRRPHRPWTGFNVLLPSISDFIFLLLFAGLTIGGLAPKLLGDAGIGWHIRAGELMLRSHTVLRTDVFSSTMGGRPWYAWEWGSDVVVGAVHQLGGLSAVACFYALAIAADKWDHPYSRGQAAFPAKWLRDHKFWPAVGRIDNVFGDRNLVCSCAGMEGYGET